MTILANAMNRLDGSFIPQVVEATSQATNATAPMCPGLPQLKH